MNNISSNAGPTPAEKRAPLAQLPQKTANDSEFVFPLSFGQQALWFLYKLAPQSWAYNVEFAARIHSHIDIPALRRAFAALVDRHPALRTTYTAREGRTVQQIHSHSQEYFLETDTRAWSQDELSNRVVEEARRPFDLEVGPVLRVNLFTSATEDILLVTAHHIAVDFWSLTVLLDELRVLYAQTGTQALPPLKKQYKDYVRWQTEMLASAEGERLWTYWQKQLGGDLPVLNLPTDRPRPPVVTYCGAEHAFKLGEELTLLKALSGGESTVYMTFLAVFFVLLYRYTGTEDILVGFPTTGRSQREFSGIVGNLINPVVLRADLSGNPTFKTFLAQVSHTVLAALKHQHYPFGLLVERLHPPQDTSRSPLFQVMFVFKLQPVEELSEFPMAANTAAHIDFGGLSAEPFELAQQSAQFDLTLEIISTGGSLTGVFKYNTDLFEASTIARMTGHFQTMLEGVVVNPDQLISTLPLLTASERLTLLVESNNAQVDYPQDVCHQMFEAQVERTPEAIAVVFATEHLTYRQLNTRANRLAHHLQILGVEPEVLVGICIERSLDMVVALLGILKAGGAYVFLDPTYPQERLTFMLEETQVPVLLTQSRLVEKLPEHAARVVYLDTGWEGEVHGSGENPASVVAAQNLAYVMYTSGSTGRPKGVTITHGSVRHYVESINTGLQINASDVYLHTASFSFSSSVRQLLVPLSQGAKVLIATYEQTRDPLKIFDVIQKHRVTVFDSVRSFWQYGLEALKNLDQASRIALFKSNLRQIVFSGGLLTWEIAKTLLLEFEYRPRIVNIYGQTETIGASLYPLPVEFDNEDGFVPTGKPISNTQIYILNSQLELVPIGVLGELHVGGAGLARGYLNRPELTSEKFIANPFCNEPGARIYKTGDLARYLPDGNIENLGRIDDQVKLRGMRVELGEIESVLGQHPSVQTTVVMAREDKRGDKSLIAYIVLHRKYKPDTPHTSLTPSIDSLQQNTTSYELRRFLKEKLPEYMIPSAFVMLDALPLTPNGKVDRRALPAPNQASLEERAYSEYVAPQDTVELELTKIWEEVLGVQPIGVKDNFFEVGGHSMLAVSLFTQIEQKFGKNLPLATLFHATTVEQLSSILRQEEGLDPWSMLVAIQTGGDKPPLFCVHGADGNILVFQNLARHLGPDQPVYGLQAKGLDGKQTPHTQVEEMATDYIRLMRTVQSEGAYLLAGFSSGGVVAFEMAQQLHKQGQKVALVVLFDTYSPAVYYKPSSSHNWVSHHLSNLLRLGPKEKLNYFLEGTKAWLHKIRCKFYPEIGLSLAQAHKKLLPTYNSITINQSTKYIDIFTAQKQAVIDYVPQVYSDRLILFRSAELPWWLPHDLELGWGGLAAKGLEIQDIPGDHHNILRDNVQVLSEKLRVYLDEVQT